MAIQYTWDSITQENRPTAYPGERSTNWIIPDTIRADFSRLNSVIETKYPREYLKICAFYNKLFPSLKTTSWIRNTYNVQPFTYMDQERDDTGTGISSNYLKQIVDQITSRLGTVSFNAALLSDIPTLEYIIYKDEVERVLRKMTRDAHLSRMVMEVFHDAAILGYSHVIIDPVTGRPFKASDYEVGFNEAQYSHDAVRQLVYRDYLFPTTSVDPYIGICDKQMQAQLQEQIRGTATVDLKFYFDCPAQEAYVIIGGTVLPPIPYPFETVKMCTFAWDIGFSKVTSTSLFDLLYPIQRELNKINAKIQQMIRMYKGAVPVFNSDVDLAMKAITNGSGEALYIDSARPANELMTVINPTPLDPALSAEVTARKTEMYELAGIQQMSFDMENMRSAAAVIAVDQTRDIVFQAQLDGISTFSKQLYAEIVAFNAATLKDDVTDWEMVNKLLVDANIELKAVHSNGPLGGTNSEQGAKPPDFQQMQIARKVNAIMDGTVIFDDLGYIVPVEQVKQVCAVTMVKLDAMGITVPDTMQRFMIDAFIEDVKNGVVQL